MGRNFEYTSLAQRYTARYPVLTYVGTQVNFWIVANLLLVIIMDLQVKIISEVFHYPIGQQLGSLVVVAIVLGVLEGLCLGLAGYYLDRPFLRKMSLGRVILTKTFGSILALGLITLLLRYVLFDLLIRPVLDVSVVEIGKATWRYLFYLLLVYYSFMTLLINFINQVNKKYGPGVLVPLLMGKYRKPREEERIFMFMDLKSSTAAAEQLGHVRYSALIRDCFADINEMLFPYCAQVYQYVGDEIVLTWPASEGLHDHLCIRFFFACKSRIQRRSHHYLSHYGIVPVFKAGVHMGLVSVVEIGEIKKDIAYHGDTLNTTARIQSVCNGYNRDLLVSEYLLEKTGDHPLMRKEHLGMILLKGKSEEVGVLGLEWKDQTGENARTF
jgi:adenylate cyclase